MANQTTAEAFPGMTPEQREQADEWLAAERRERLWAAASPFPDPLEIFEFFDEASHLILQSGRTKAQAKAELERLNPTHTFTSVDDVFPDEPMHRDGTPREPSEPGSDGIEPLDVGEG